MSSVNLEVRDLKKYFGKIQAVNRVSFSIEKGQTISIIGPSGAGKSALLRSIIQLEKPNSGEIYIDGEILFSKKENEYPLAIAHADLIKRKSKIGMIFQRFNLFPHKSVIENIIEAPITVNKVSKDEAVSFAEKLLERVGLSDKRNAYPNELSGGQQQRVAIARALAMKPEILLCDEPTSSLDPELVGEVLTVLKELSLEKMTMIVVSHEMAFVRELSGKVAFMENGVMLDIRASKDFFENPKNDRIKDFITRMF